MTDHRGELIVQGWTGLARWWLGRAVELGSDTASGIGPTPGAPPGTAPPTGDTVLDAGAKTVSLAAQSWLYFVNELLDTAAVATMAPKAKLSFMYTTKHADGVRRLELTGPLVKGQHSIDPAEIVFEPANFLAGGQAQFRLRWTKPTIDKQGAFGGVVRVLLADGSVLEEMKVFLNT